MNNLFVKTGDTVVLLTGDDKYRGKEGKVLAVSPKEGKVIVEGLNVVKKHVKPRKAGDPSGIIETESAIYACKVQVICPKCGKNLNEGACGCDTREIDPRLAKLAELLNN